MVDYLKTILPRLQQYSKKLNDEANFADIPWAFVDEEGDKVTYIFRRNNELLVSKKGDVETGHWEYLPMLQSLLIQHKDRKRMYNQGFLDKAVMILRKDGTEELLALANTQMIPDLDIQGYLEKQANLLQESTSEKKKLGFFSRKVKDSEIQIAIEMPEGMSSPAYVLGSNAFYPITKEPLKTGKYVIEDGVVLYVQDGKIVRYEEPGGLSLLIAIFLIVMIIATFIIFLLI